MNEHVILPCRKSSVRMQHDRELLCAQSQPSIGDDVLVHDAVTVEP